MKLLTFPIRLLLRLVILPIKVVLATAGFTFRAGFKAGTLPVKGSAVAVRTLGLKAVVLFIGGVALGVVIGRRLGASGVELAEASYPASFGGADRGPAEATTTASTAPAEVEAEVEAADELEAVIDQALGQTGGELAVDAVEDTVGGADV
jgi:hypothetical protein